MKELERSVISNGEHAAKGKAVLDNIFHVMYKFCVFIFGDLKKKNLQLLGLPKYRIPVV